MSTNPNNCSTCRFKQMHDDPKGATWCYMFRDEPVTVCMQHTDREMLTGKTGVLQRMKLYKELFE